MTSYSTILKNSYHIPYYSNGANVILCSQDGYKVPLPEMLVKEGTNLFERLKSEDIEALRDPFGKFTFILEGVNRYAPCRCFNFPWVRKLKVTRFIPLVNSDIAAPCHSYILWQVRLRSCRVTRGCLSCNCCRWRLGTYQVM